MKSVFLIKTPLQLLNAIEARHYFNLQVDECVLVIMGDRKSQPQILMLADAVDEWGAVVTLNSVDLFGVDTYKDNKNIFLRKIQELNFFKKSFFNVRRLNKISSQLSEVEYIFVGYARYIYMKHFINITPHKKAFLLDDGNATILLAKERFEGRASNSGDGFVKIIKRYGKRYFQGIKDEDQKSINYFTMYDILPSDNDVVFKNSFSYLRSSLDLLPVVGDIYFIGSPISETGIVSLQSYMFHLNKVKKYFAGKNILYIAHRRESRTNLDMIKTKMGFDVVSFDYPLEYQLAFVGPRPAVLASFISSALDSCRLIFGDKLKIISFRLDLVGSPKKDVIEQIYESYNPYINNDFNVVTDY